MDLNNEDFELILQSLELTKHNFENYDKYPSYEFKQDRINKVDETIIKVKKASEIIKN